MLFSENFSLKYLSCVNSSTLNQVRYGLDSNVTEIVNAYDKIRDFVNDKRWKLMFMIAERVGRRKFHYVNVFHFLEKFASERKLGKTHFKYLHGRLEIIHRRELNFRIFLKRKIFFLNFMKHETDVKRVNEGIFPGKCGS